MAALSSVAAFQLASVASFAGVRTGSSARQTTTRVQVAPVRCSVKKEEPVSRRTMAAGAAVALLAFAAGPSLALGPPNEPPIESKGTKETKKKYANICVSNATASVCHG
eukprot:jgi/Mesen1/9956/ME000071S09368